MSKSTIEVPSSPEETLKELKALAEKAGVPWDYIQEELKRGDDLDEIRASLEERAKVEAALDAELVPKWHSFYRADGSMGKSPANKVARAMEAEDEGKATPEQLQYLAEVRAKLAAMGR